MNNYKFTGAKLQVQNYRCKITGAILQVQNYRWIFTGLLTLLHFSWYKRAPHTLPSLALPQKLVVLAVVAPIYFMHGRLVVPAVATVDLVALLKNVHMFLPLRHLTPLWTRCSIRSTTRDQQQLGSVVSIGVLASNLTSYSIGRTGIELTCDGSVRVCK